MAILTGAFVWNAPESELKRRLTPILTPAMFSSGLDQNWGVFSPDPPTHTFELVAVIEYADGSKANWRVPALKGLVISPYRIYRWRKYAEHVRLDTGAQLWEPLSRWIARSQSSQGLPVTITLKRRWKELEPAGEKGPPPEWREYNFFVFDVLKDRPR